MRVRVLSPRFRLQSEIKRMKAVIGDRILRNRETTSPTQVSCTEYACQGILVLKNYCTFPDLTFSEPKSKSSTPPQYHFHALTPPPPPPSRHQPRTSKVKLELEQPAPNPTQNKSINPNPEFNSIQSEPATTLLLVPQPNSPTPHK